MKVPEPAFAPRVVGVGVKCESNCLSGIGWRSALPAFDCVVFFEPEGGAAYEHMCFNFVCNQDVPDGGVQCNGESSGLSQVVGLIYDEYPLRRQLHHVFDKVLSLSVGIGR